MGILKVQTASHNIDSEVIVLPAPPTPGNYLILFESERDTDFDPSSDPPGFTALEPAHRTHATAFTNRYGKGWYRVVQAGDDATYNTQGWSSCMADLSEFSGITALYDTATQSDQSSATNTCGGSIIPPGGLDVLVIGMNTIGGAGTSGGNGATALTPVSGTTELSDMQNNGTSAPRHWSGYKIVTSAAGAQTVSATQDDATAKSYGGVTAMFIGGAVAPVADFTADLNSIFEGGSVAFEDLSTGTPTSWAWDFGDGGTSTSQDPTHVFATAGSYTITLTATNAEGSDDEVKTAYITVSVDVGYEPPAPGGVLLEIYAADPNSFRWGVAKWGQATWGSSAWQDVTPEGVEIQILWGAQDPEMGILSLPSADSWAISFYDPFRRLDPANADGPFYTDLLPYLPVRVSHRQRVIALGYAESIGHAYAKSTGNGYMRVTNNLSRLANAKVPIDSILADTMYARAQDAITAAGLILSVQSPLGTDPPLVLWGDLDPVPDWSAWEWIVDAARQCHYIPFVNRRTGVVEFRAWATPLTRGRSINSPELVDLQVISEYRGLFSVVQALDDGVPPGTIVERALTPPPRYGARTFTRSEPTLDAGDWAQVILSDRALPGYRWVPGIVYPLTADSVETLNSIEAVELISMAVPEQDPPVSATAIVVGGEIIITGKRDDEAVWRFSFEAAQTAVEPLIETGGEPTEYLLATGGGEFLYPST